MTATLLWTAVSVIAATAPPCGAICGQWQLDTAGSDDVKAALDTAMASFKEPRPERISDREARTLEGAAKADLERSLGPINTRPGSTELRAELERLLKAPEKLSIATRGNDFLIGDRPGSPRRLSPGAPHARVDIEGTAEIRCNFKDGRLTVSERYDRRRAYSETYAVRRSDGTLLVTREVRRQGIKPVIVKALYRPG